MSTQPTTLPTNLPVHRFPRNGKSFIMGRNTGPLPTSTCTICTEPLTEEVLKLEHCDHHFHRSCIRTWIETSADYRCPNCREKLDTQWYEVNEAGVVVCTEPPPRYHEEEDDDGLDEEYYEGDYHGEDYWERRDRLRQTRRLGLEVDRMPFVVRMRLRVRTRTWDARERWRGNRYVGWMRVAVKMLRPRRRGHEDEDAWGLDGWVL